jgi:predicted HicB family RNase H-like nuclease
MIISPDKHRHPIASDGTHPDLDKLVIRVPFDVSHQITAMALRRRQSVSLYLSKLLQKHVEEPDE